jgi:hypothetical protein
MRTATRTPMRMAVRTGLDEARLYAPCRGWALLQGRHQVSGCGGSGQCSHDCVEGQSACDVNGRPNEPHLVSRAITAPRQRPSGRELVYPRPPPKAPPTQPHAHLDFQRVRRRSNGHQHVAPTLLQGTGVQGVGVLGDAHRERGVEDGECKGMERLRWMESLVDEEGECKGVERLRWDRVVGLCPRATHTRRAPPNTTSDSAAAPAVGASTKAPFTRASLERKGKESGEWE